MHSIVCTAASPDDALQLFEELVRNPNNVTAKPRLCAGFEEADGRSEEARKYTEGAIARSQQRDSPRRESRLAGVQGLVDTARAGRTTPADMAGGTITITNVGVFGVDGGTPIINPGESAILCMGRAVAKPWVVDGAVAVRQVMQLTLSFDHRLVDGALGSQVLASVARSSEDPAVELALG